MATMQTWYVKCARCGKAHVMGEITEWGDIDIGDRAEFALAPTLPIICLCGATITTRPSDNEMGWESFIDTRKPDYGKWLGDEINGTRALRQ